MFAAALGFVAALFLTDRTRVAHLAAVDDDRADAQRAERASPPLRHHDVPRVAS